MKKINFKKTICASLAALAICPAIAAVKPTASTYAAGAFSTVVNSNQTFRFDENQITVSSNQYYPVGANIKAAASGNIIKSIDSNNYLPVFERREITINIKGNYANDVTSKLNSVKLKAKFNVDGKTNSHSYDVKKVKKNNDGSYNIVFDFLSYGTSFSFETTKIEGVTNMKYNYTSMTPVDGSSKYYRIEAKTPDGDNIYLSLRNNGKVSYINMEKWAKRLCVYANALSKTTGVKLGTLYICFDFPYLYNGDAPAFSSNIYMNTATNKLGFVAVSKSKTDYILDQMASGKNQMTWCMLHEIAHSYASYTKPSNFKDSYYPGDDDFYCNARGITAIQNCDNLRNMDIYFSESEHGNYNEIMNIIDMTGFPFSEDVYYTYAKKLVNIGKKYGWNKLEDFFAASSYKDYRSDDNMKAVKAINELTGKNISYSDNYLRFVNGLRELYKLCWNHQSFNAEAFKSFVSGDDIGLKIVNDVITLKKY